MKFRVNIVLFLVLSSLLLIPASAFCIKNPKLDSLEQALAKSAGIEKVNTLIQLGRIYINGVYIPADPVKSRDFFRKAAALANRIGYVNGFAETKRQTAYLFALNHQNDSALIEAELALALSSKTGDTLGIIHSLWELAECNLILQHYPVSIDMYNRAYELSRSVKNLKAQASTAVEVANFYRRLGMFDKEEEYQLEYLKVQIIEKKNPAMNFYSMGRLYVFHGRYRDAIRYFKLSDSAFYSWKPPEIPDEPPTGFWQAKQLGSIGRAFHFWGYNDSALFYHRKSLERFANCGFKFLNVDVANQWEGIGLVYTYWGVYDSARIYFEKSRKHRDKLKDWLGVGACYDGLGQISWLLGNHEEAVNYFIDALAVKSKAGLTKQPQRMVSYRESISNSHLYLGKVYAEWNNIEAALREFKISLELYMGIGFVSGQADALVEIGKTHIKTGRYDQAKQIFTNAMKLCKRAGDLPGQAVVLQNVGDLYYVQKEYGIALDNYRKSEKLQKTTGNPAELAKLEIRIGNTLSAIHQTAEAVVYLSRAISGAGKLRIQGTLMEGHFAMADLLENSGHSGDALSHFEKGLEIKEALYRQKINASLADIDARYQADRNTFQIVLLSKDAQLQEIKLNRLRIPIFSLGGMVILIVLIFVIITRLVRLKTEYRSNLLRQRLLRTQLNPRLVFQALNVIGELVRNSESERAVSYLAHFSRFINTLLQSSQKDLIPLEKELILINSYLDLQLAAHPGRFNFKITLAELMEPGDLILAPFLVFPYIEKAVRNVLLIRKGDGNIQINYSLSDKKLIVIVEDNGKASGTDRTGEPGSSNMLKEGSGKFAFLIKRSGRKPDVEWTAEAEKPGKPAVNRIRMIIPVIKS
jgi:tetratricopeptide (TPR) repeat protein